MTAVRAHVSASRSAASKNSARPVVAAGPDRQAVVSEYEDKAYQVWGVKSFRALFFEDTEFRDKVLATSRETLSGIELDFYEFAAGCRQHGLRSTDFVPFEFRLLAHQSWGGRSFRSLFFEDLEFRDKTLASSQESLSGTALEFYHFAAGCCQHGFQASDFDLVEDEVQVRRAQENVAERTAQRMAAERRAKELAERKRELAHAARVRQEAEAKARLFATSVQSASKSESSAGASARGVSQPSSATQSAAQGAPSAGSRQSGRPGPALAVRDSILQTRLCRRLVELRLEEDILEAVLGQLQAMFGQGRAWELANRAGFADVERWEHFVADVQQAKNSWSEGLLIVHVQRHVSELLFVCNVLSASKRRSAMRRPKMFCVSLGLNIGSGRSGARTIVWLIVCCSY